MPGMFFIENPVKAENARRERPARGLEANIPAQRKDIPLGCGKH
jgi:hypothetical protein